MEVEHNKSLVCTVNHGLIITLNGLIRTIHMYACKQLHTFTHHVETGTFEFVFFCLVSFYTEDRLRQVLFGSAEQRNSLLVWSVKRHDQLKLILGWAFCFDLISTVHFESVQF